jgi:predicted nucleic acid-binding protein
MQRLYRDDMDIATWWGSTVECASAIARLERDAALAPPAAAAAFRRLSALRHAWHEIDPVEEIREMATRLLRVHALRAGDALQLAAALLAAEARPSTLPFACLDDRLAAAARREGFPVLGGGRGRGSS